MSARVTPFRRASAGRRRQGGREERDRQRREEERGQKGTRLVCEGGEEEEGEGRGALREGERLLDEPEDVVGAGAGGRGGEDEAEALLDEVGAGVVEGDAACGVEGCSRQDWARWVVCRG